VDDAGLKFRFYTCSKKPAPDFIPDVFDGPKEGYSFNINGEKGIGYYKVAPGDAEEGKTPANGLSISLHLRHDIDRCLLVRAESPDNFVNDSAMMIAFERSLETARPDALFQDPFALAMAGKKGEGLSSTFGTYAAGFGFPEWPEFHKMWTAVRTKFIDDRLKAHAATGEFTQLVNLGAGVDTRAYRLDCFSAFTAGAHLHNSLL